MDRVTPMDSSRLLADYAAALSSKAPATGDAYVRAVRQFLRWLATKPGQSDGFHPDQLTRTTVELYLTSLEQQGISVAHRARVKAAISSFATLLIEEQGWLRRNPTRGIAIPAQALLAPRELSDDQRFVLRTLVERDGSLRSAALFALGYWAGCRVSDVPWLRLADTHLTRNTGWIRAGHKGGKLRDLDLAPPARLALAAYLAEERAQALAAGRPFERLYMFSSQRHERLTEAGIHHWLRALKAQATKAQWELIHDITYHDLRHDFAHRARAAGWSLEAVAYYLGHITNKGTPAIQTTVRYTQVSREQVKALLTTFPG